MAVVVLLGSVGCRTALAPRGPEDKNARSARPMPSVVIPSPVPRVSEARIEQPSERFTYLFRASLFSNLFYFVDCISGSTRCSREAFEKLAQDELGGLSEEDRAALKSWKEIRGRYRGRITLADDPDDMALPLPHSHRQVERRTRLAGYTSSTTPEYEGKLAMFVDRPDAARATAVLERFLPRFERYWQKAEPELDLDELLTRGVTLQDASFAAKKHPSFVYADLSKGRPALFVFVADTDAEMTKLVRRFGEVPAMKAGVLVD